MPQDVGCVKKWREIVQDGGCVKNMAAARNVIMFLKKGGNRVSPDPRWRLCVM
jgi:hypothetical protein